MTKAGRGFRGALPGAVAVTVVLALLAAAAPAQAQTRTLAPDGGQMDGFGTALAMDGDTLVVGAPNNNDHHGAAYVFTRTAGETWTQTAKLTASDGEYPDHFGSSVAIDGNTIVVGAPRDDDDRGAVYLFDRTGGNRTEREKLVASDRSKGDVLGTSVAVEGTVVVAGAPYDDNPSADIASNHGAVYTFAATGAAARPESAKLTVVGNTGVGGYWVGASVAIDGGVIAAGAPSYQVGGELRGAVFTFAATGASTRNETARLTSSAGVFGYLGGAVAIQGDRIVAGDNQAYDARGTALVFAASGDYDRHELEQLRPGGGGAQNYGYGQSLAISNDYIVVGAPNYGSTGYGAAYVFTRSGGAGRAPTWFTAGGSSEAHAAYSTGIAVDDDRVVGGAPNVDNFQPTYYQDQGRVYSETPELYVSRDSESANVGSVTTNPGGPCTLPCTVPGLLGDQIAVTAVAPAGYYFAGWSNYAPCNGSTSSCTVTLNSNPQLAATFKFGSPPNDVTPPTVTIDSGPAAGTTITTASATFGFSADEAATFECAHDSGGFASCTAAGSDTWTGLTEGQHTFKVRATDGSGNTSTEVTRTFGVDLPDTVTNPPASPPVADTTAPQTTITTAPPKTVKVKKKATVRLAFSASEAATFVCSLDGGAFTACSSPTTFKLKIGKHSIAVAAVDAAGNRDASPATVSVKVKKKAKKKA